MELFPLPRSTQGKSFHQLCARFCAVIIVDFYIDDFIFALFIFMTDGKAVNYNGSEIIGLINFKYGKRTACRDNVLPRMRYFPEKQGKGQQCGINPNLLKVTRPVPKIFDWEHVEETLTLRNIRKTEL